MSVLLFLMLIQTLMVNLMLAESLELFKLIVLNLVILLSDLQRQLQESILLF